MKTNPTSLLSDICPAVQKVLIQLLREEYQAILVLPSPLPDDSWAQIVRLANPTLVYISEPHAYITICPDSRSTLLSSLQEQLHHFQP